MHEFIIDCHKKLALASDDALWVVDSFENFQFAVFLSDVEPVFPRSQTLFGNGLVFEAVLRQPDPSKNHRA